MLFAFSEILQIRLKDGQCKWKTEKKLNKTEQDRSLGKNQTQTLTYQAINATGKCACSRNKLAFLNF